MDKFIEFITSNNKNKLYITLKFLLYIIPIYFLTNKVHTHFFDKYDIYKYENLETFFKSQDGIYWVIIFCIIYVTAYCLEKFVLPFLFVLVRPLKGERIDKISKKILESKYTQTKTAKASIVYYKEDTFNLTGLYSSILSIPIWLTLLFLNLNSFLGYLTIVIIWAMTYYYFRLSKNIYM